MENLWERKNFYYSECMKPKISIITLGVQDFQKSFDFYSKGLGLKTHGYKEGLDHVFFVMEGTWLALYPVEKLAKDAQIPLVENNEFSRITLAHNVKSKAKVDEVWQFAVDAGATAVKNPEEVFWGGYSGYFSDPDNYLWEVAYNPFEDLT